MAEGQAHQYRWQGEQQYRRPARSLAPSRYMALLMDWIEGLINDEDVFPTRVGESAWQAGQKLFFQFCFVFSLRPLFVWARIVPPGTTQARP